ncbi:hypothetical protein FRC03_006266 [Tulasnella sp. 419]|nr:hypothetical protein FRC03_006266 [Tulasnella sp. 419]
MEQRQGGKVEMSRALGQAYLSHQVAQLEKAVTNNSNTRNTRGGGRGGGRGRGGRSSSLQGEPTPRGPRNQQQWTQQTVPKVADRVVVDSSVLIHALSQVKQWCRDDRSEIVIVPLEALNTLDLLKKGNTQIAIRARAASRLLEAQVGSNPRIRVQRDEEYIAWEDIDLVDSTSPVGGRQSPRDPRSSPDSSSDVERQVGATRNNQPPEWLKRTVCCAKWEASQPESGSVVLALVCLPTNTRNNDSFNRFETRASGTQTRHWASRTGLEVLDIDPPKPSTEKADSFNHNHLSEDTGVGNSYAKPRGHQQDFNATSSSHHNNHNRKRSNSSGYNKSPPSPRGPLVDKPRTIVPGGLLLPAGKVIRVLARGEKLDP